jgi:hypothetical protein
MRGSGFTGRNLEMQSDFIGVNGKCCKTSENGTIDWVSAEGS